MVCRHRAFKIIKIPKTKFGFKCLKTELSTTGARWNIKCINSTFDRQVIHNIMELKHEMKSNFPLSTSEEETTGHTVVACGNIQNT